MWPIAFNILFIPVHMMLSSHYVISFLVTSVNAITTALILREEFILEPL